MKSIKRIVYKNLSTCMVMKKHFNVSCPFAAIARGALPLLCSADKCSFAITQMEKLKLRQVG